MNRKLSGQVLVIGDFSTDFLDKLKNNKKITYSDHLNIVKKDKQKQQIKKNRKEIISIFKLRKKYPKKSFDFIIIDWLSIGDYDKYWLRDTIYLCKGFVLIYNYNESIVRKYERYNVKIERKKYLQVDVSQAKNRPIKEKFYFIQDFFEQIFNYISDFLTM